LAGADYGEGFASGEMVESFVESAGEMELRRFRGDAEDGFAEAEDAVGGGLEGLGSGIVRIASDDDLKRVMCEKRGGQAIGRCEEAVLGSDAGEGFERFLGEPVVAFVAREGVHSNESDGGDGIGAGRWRILKGLAADIEATHGGGVGRAIEEAAAFRVAVAGYGKVYGFLRGGEIAGIEGDFVGIEKREGAKDLILE